MRVVKSSAIPDANFVYEKALYRNDSYLGWICIEGTHRPKIVSMDGEWPTTIQIGADGYRVTSRAPRTSPPKRKIWIYGCSFVFGDWLPNDESTLAFKIQDALPEDEVRNFGIPAYGTTHTVLQLTEHLKHDKPDIVICGYYHAHQWRNTASPHWLKLLAKHQDVFNGLTTIPKTWISEEGEISIGYVNIHHEYLDKIDPQVIETAPWYNMQVTQFLYKYIQDLAKKHRFRLICGMFSRDVFSQQFVANGIETVDLTVHVQPGYVLMPFDHHPNERANQVYADLLLDRIAGGSA